MKALTVKVRRTRPNSDLPLPAYQTALAAGVDLRADLDAELLLSPMERVAVPTGLSFEIPEGFEGQIRPRSGLALSSGVTCLNSPGTIDADYRGEVKVILVNLSNAPVRFQRGDRIAQMVFAPVQQVLLLEASELTGSQRGDGGFGSTGR